VATSIFRSIEGMQTVYEDFIKDTTDTIFSSFRPFFFPSTPAPSVPRPEKTMS
jgi:hypothetical protein